MFPFPLEMISILTYAKFLSPSSSTHLYLSQKPEPIDQDHVLKLRIWDIVYFSH